MVDVLKFAFYAVDSLNTIIVEKDCKLDKIVCNGFLIIHAKPALAR